MRVENGWFCVKLPGPEQLKRHIPWEEARKLDVEYFKKAPWASHNELATCYTVGRLTEKLGTILSSAITARRELLLINDVVYRLTVHSQAPLPSYRNHKAAARH